MQKLGNIQIKFNSQDFKPKQGQNLTVKVQKLRYNTQHKDRGKPPVRNQPIQRGDQTSSKSLEDQTATPGQCSSNRSSLGTDGEGQTGETDNKAR